MKVGKDTRIILSNHEPIPTTPAKPGPSVSHLYQNKEVTQSRSDTLSKQVTWGYFCHYLQHLLAKTHIQKQIWRFNGGDCFQWLTLFWPLALFLPKAEKQTQLACMFYRYCWEFPTGYFCCWPQSFLKVTVRLAANENSKGLEYNFHQFIALA